MLHRVIIVVVASICVASACSNYTKSLEQSVTKADETAALAALHSITAAQQTYSTSNNGHFGTFEQLVAASYLDERFKGDKPKIRGYVLTLNVSDQGGEPSYSVNADPEPPLAGRHFYFDSISTITHVNPSQTATATDPPLNP